MSELYIEKCIDNRNTLSGNFDAVCDNVLSDLLNIPNIEYKDDEYETVGFVVKYVGERHLLNRNIGERRIKAKNIHIVLMANIRFIIIPNNIEKAIIEYTPTAFEKKLERVFKKNRRRFVKGCANEIPTLGHTGEIKTYIVSPTSKDMPGCKELEIAPSVDMGSKIMNLSADIDLFDNLEILSLSNIREVKLGNADRNNFAPNLRSLYLEHISYFITYGEFNNLEELYMDSVPDIPEFPSKLKTLTIMNFDSYESILPKLPEGLKSFTFGSLEGGFDMSSIILPDSIEELTLSDVIMIPRLPKNIKILTLVDVASDIDIRHTNIESINQTSCMLNIIRD